jgi:hypothetical protein
MKPKFYAILLVMLASGLFQSAYAFSSATIIVQPPKQAAKDINPLSLITAKQFLELSPKKYQELTGRKMSFIQKMELRIAQHKVKKMLRRGEVVTMADVQKKFREMSSMDLLGFLLGLILGPIGVIIALILKETGDVQPSVLRWSLYGFLVWLVIALLVILL